MIIMDYEIDKLHAVLQEILDFTVEICEENALSYCLAYGTALGAFRHQGFIPWDDDLDIVMPREDYEKLIEIMKENPSEGYILQNEDNEDNYFLSFAKIRKRGTIFIESIAEGTYKENGIYIDIFPLDHVENKESVRTKLINFRIGYWRHALKLVSCPELYKKKLGKIRYMVERCLCLPVSVIGVNAGVKRMHKIMQSVGNKDSSYVAQYDQVPERAILKKDIYFPPKKIEFESKMYYAPNNIHEYLVSQYGKNYMELPPIEQRRTHQPARIEF